MAPLWNPKYATVFNLVCRGMNMLGEWIEEEAQDWAVWSEERVRSLRWVVSQEKILLETMKSIVEAKSPTFPYTRMFLSLTK